MYCDTPDRLNADLSTSSRPLVAAADGFPLLTDDMLVDPDASNPLMSLSSGGCLGAQCQLNRPHDEDETQKRNSSINETGSPVPHSASTPPTLVHHTPVPGATPSPPSPLHHLRAFSLPALIRDPLNLLTTCAHSRCLRPYTSPNKPCKTKKQNATAALHAWSLSFTLNLTGNQPKGTYPRVKGFTGLWVGGFGLS